MDGDKPLVLVVDDETHIVHVLSLKLSNAGYEVITAHDGEEGLVLALKHRPNLLITDQRMPYKTGVELCQELTAHDPNLIIPALLLTGRHVTMSEEKMKQAHIAGIITKPFSPREVLAKVQSLVGQPKQLYG